MNLAERAGPEVAAELADPGYFLRWLAEGRHEIGKGIASEDPAAMSRAIAERVRQEAAADPPAEATAAAPFAQERSITP